MCLATVDAAIGLVKHLLSKLTGKLEHHLDVLGLSISLMLSSLCKEDVLVSEKKDPAFKKVFGVCEVALLDWVKNHNVIGGSFFGGRIQNTTILYSLDELKVYTYYIILKSCDCVNKNGIFLRYGRDFCPLKL